METIQKMDDIEKVSYMSVYLHHWRGDMLANRKPCLRLVFVCLRWLSQKDLCISSMSCENTGDVWHFADGTLFRGTIMIFCCPNRIWNRSCRSWRASTHCFLSVSGKTVGLDCSFNHKSKLNDCWMTGINVRVLLSPKVKEPNIIVFGCARTVCWASHSSSKLLTEGPWSCALLRLDAFRVCEWPRPLLLGSYNLSDLKRNSLRRETARVCKSAV